MFNGTFSGRCEYFYTAPLTEAVRFRLVNTLLADCRRTTTASQSILLQFFRWISSASTEILNGRKQKWACSTPDYGIHHFHVYIRVWCSMPWWGNTHRSQIEWLCKNDMELPNYSALRTKQSNGTQFIVCVCS